MYAAVPQPGNKTDSHTNILLIILSQFNWRLWLAESAVALGSFVKEAGASSAGVQRRWCTVCSGTLSKSAVKICCATMSRAGQASRHWRQKHTRCREASRHKYKVLGIWSTVLISLPSESHMFYVCLCVAQIASAWTQISLLLSPCFLPQPGSWHSSYDLMSERTIRSVKTRFISKWPRLIKTQIEEVCKVWWELLLDSRCLSFEVTFLDFSCVHVLVWGPSNVPVAVHSAFLQELPTHLDCEKLGLHGLHCSSTKGREANVDSKVR